MKGAIPPSEVRAGRASPHARSGHGHSATIPIAGQPDDWLHEGEWARVGPFFIYPRDGDYHIGRLSGAREYRDVAEFAFTNIEAAIDHARWMDNEARGQ